MKLESWHLTEDKAKFKIVRTDSLTDVPGDIISASEESGECCLQVATPNGPETKSFSFGPAGIRIVGRRR